MRRSDREVPAEEAWQILTEAHTCHLGLISNGRPYVVPLSYAVIDGRIYIHSAREGEKLTAIAADPRVCVEVEIVTEKPGDCYRFRSAIGFGTARLVADREAKRRALAAIAAKYEPQYPRHDNDDERISVIEIELSEITGKHRV